MSSENIENFNDFRAELLKRFFNPKSYFFLSLSTQLQDMSSIAEDVSEDDYLVIGQIVQHFIDSDNPESDLALLNGIDRFNRFAGELEDGLRHLHQPGLAPDEMKNTIEGLSHELIKTVVDVIHSEHEAKQLLEILDITLPKSIQIGDNNSSSEIAKSARSVAKSKNETGAYPLEKLDDLPNTPQIEKIESEPEFIGNFENGLQDSEGGSHSDSCSNDLDLIGVNNEVSEVIEDNLVFNEKYVAEDDPHEPFGLNVAFFQEANATNNEIKSLIERLQPGDVPRKELKILKTVFLDLRESAMVHGFSELEEITHKSQKYIESLLKDGLSFPESAVQLFQEIPTMIKCALSESLEAEDARALQAFALRLTQAPVKAHCVDSEKNKIIEAPEPNKDIDEENDRPVGTEIEVDSDLVSDHEEELVSDILNETLTENFVEEISQKDEEDIGLYLPGEDDPELLDIIKKVTNSKSETYRVPDKAGDETLFDHEKNIALQDLDEDSAVLAPAATNAPAKDDRMVNFSQEADLYFRVMDEAIEQLLLNRQSRIAFENLELAAYSLKGLARKLGLEPLAKLPELIEELVGKIILLRISPEKDTYLTIKKACTLLKKTADIHDVEKREYRELDRSLLSLIRSLDAFESTPDDMKTSGLEESKEHRNLNGMRMTNFQLRGRQSFPK